MKTEEEIKEFLNNKVLVNISGNNLKVETISIDNFIEWFKSKPKEENQDIITFKGKEYEFIESTWGDFCINCDLRELDNCTLFPRICCSEYRRDMREGYFKLIKQKELELIPYEFYYTEEDNYSWVIQFKEFIDDDNHPISYYYMLKIHDNDINSNFSCANNSWIKATPAQKQQLIDKVQEETGKVWNEDTKMFEDKPKEILVLENIKIIKYQHNRLGLVFNDNKQVLTFSEGVYIVLPLDKWDKFISCRLEKTTFEDLKVGDLFYDNSIESQQRLVDIRNYKIKIKNTDTISISSNNGIILDSCYNMQSRVYKVIPIK